MKNTKVLVAVGLLVAIIAGVLVMTSKEDEPSADKTSNSESSTNQTEEAKNKSSDLDLPKQTVGQQPDCSLYTLDDISKIWGVPMIDTDVDGSKVIQITGPENYQYECDYNETDSGQGVTVSIQYKVYEDEDAAKTSIENTRSGAKVGDEVYFINDELSDIGDEAFFSSSVDTESYLAKSEEQMYARKGNVVVLLTAVNLDGKDASFRDKIKETYMLRLQ